MNTTNYKNEYGQTPLLLAPCGSPEALDAAIAGGANEVYFGTTAFNARMSAKNFTGDILEKSIEKCRLYGVKSNITLNTLLFDKELDDLLKTAERLYKLGADALIVADLGAASLINKYFPDFELHASTQAMGHNIEAAKLLQKLGFSRMVAARELDFDNLKTLCAASPIEIEMFIHGAICVSQSGGCLASSLIGGRSGNRGECAQPCRLPYKCQGKKGGDYPLSIKDMCLAEHITEILTLGVTSLKIEGRMKNPDYVYGVTSIYRQLLNEKRNATEKELSSLRALFSRSGFTDGYFTKRIDVGMLGIRTDKDKTLSEMATYDSKIIEDISKERRQSINLSAKVKQNAPAELTASLGTLSVTVTGDIPEKANNRPLTKEDIQKNIIKLGSSPFKKGEVTIELDDGLILSLSSLNKLRRDAVDALCEKLKPKREHNLPENLQGIIPQKAPKAPNLKTALFQNDSQIPENASVDIAFVPIEKLSPKSRANGVSLPPVIFDSETKEIETMLKAAKKQGIKHLLISNIGHLHLAKKYEMICHGDQRLNICNSHTASVLYNCGFDSLTASCELSLPRLRDIGLPPVIYGKIPLMTLEKCVIRDLYSCEKCNSSDFLYILDRKDISFPLSRAYKHRNILYNSVPVYMGDRQDELTRYNIKGGHYIFTDEKPDDIKSLLLGKAIVQNTTKVRRIKQKNDV